MERRYQGWKVQLLPIVMGMLGTVDRLSKDLQAIGCFESYKVRLIVQELQRVTLLGSAQMLCQQLAIR